MTDSSLTNKLAALSPQQLAALRSRLNAPTSSMAVQPRQSLTALPQNTTAQVNDQTAWRTTSTQARLWFIDQYLGPNPVYNVVRSLRLSGTLNIPVLEAACHYLVQRHEALRTTIHDVDGVPYQLIGAGNRFCLEIIDLRPIPAADQEAALQQQLQTHGRQPFNLATDSLLRVVLFQLGDTDFGLLLVIHHIVSDGWSLGLLAKELSGTYQALLDGSNPNLPPVPLQFADYAVWLETQLQQEKQARDRQYWQKKLSGELPVLELPCDRPRSPQQTYNGNQTTLRFDPATVQGLKKLGLQTKTSLFMVLLASFKVLLHRYSHQTDIIVGTPVANRSRSELETIIGYFVDNLPLRTDLSGNPSFEELLQRVRQTALDAYAHPYPFAEILTALPPNPDVSRPPVFSVLMSLQNTPDADFALPNIRFARPQTLENQEKTQFSAKVALSSYQLAPDIQVARFDLTVLLKEENDGEIAGIISYNRDLFNPDTIERLIGHWHNLVRGILTNLQTPIGQLPLLTPTERQQILVDWNQMQTDYAQGQRCIHELFEQQVNLTPDTVAVVYEQEQLSYQELNAKANQLAHYLQDLGVGPETLVGICVERSLDMVIGLLAILKAGGAYVPVDPSYPQERLQFILQDAQISVLLTQASLLEKLPQQSAQIFCLDRDWPEVAPHSPLNLTTELTPENLAYVIYTSGSTGRPKGVMNRHGSICNRLLWMQEAYGLTPEDQVLQKTPFSFDVSVWEFFWPLMVGARLIVARPEGHKDSRYLIDLMEQQQITTVHFVPSMLAVFLQDPEIDRLTCLKRVICSGEALSIQLQRDFFDHLNCELHNLYGPTEAAIDVTAWSCRSDSTDSFVPIGRPIANTQIYILGQDLQPVPIGASGELHIGGVGLARGYLNRPQLTQERFITNPFGAGCLYKTGDLARYRSDGAIEYLGRIDYQVKLRGFRIELGEIEAVLAQHQQVKQCVAMVREDTPGNKRLVAYVVCDDALESEFGGDGLKAHLKQHLPDYMVPNVLVPLNTIPLTPNGKVDRKALRAPDPLERSLTNEFLAPRTPMEVQLSQIWGELLKMDEVGIHDNFFELGGHSLLATQLVSRIRSEFQVALPLLEIFDTPTIADLTLKITLMSTQPAGSQELEYEQMSALLDELEHLSEDEVETYLSAQD